MIRGPTTLLGAWVVHALCSCAAPEASPTRPEDCLTVGDEDLSGSADCDDPSCADRWDCRGAFLTTAEATHVHRWTIDDPNWESLEHVGTGQDFQIDLDGDSHIDLGFFGYRRQPDEDSREPAYRIAEFRIQPSSLVGPEGADLEAAEFIATAPWLRGASFTGACDINGDGFDDFIAVPSSIDLFNGDLSYEGLSLVLITGTNNVAPKSQSTFRAIPLGAYGTDALHAACVGEVDGDGHDDILLSVFGLTVLLEGERLMTASWVGDAIDRGWTSGISGAERVGDLDGDGLDDLWMQISGGRGLDDRDIEPIAMILPGSRDFDAQLPAAVSFADESRPARRLSIENPVAPELREGMILTHRVEEVFGGGPPEIMITGVQPRRVLIYAVPELSALDGDVLVAHEDLLATIDVDAPTHVGGLPSGFYAYPGPVADVSGDGILDLIVVGHVPVVPEEGGGPAQLNSDGVAGWFIFLGDGTPQAFNRELSHADLFIRGYPYEWFMRGNLSVDPERDGDSLPDMIYTGSPRYGAGVIPGSTIQAALSAGR